MQNKQSSKVLLRAIVFCAFLFSATICASAERWRFLPGDAYFHASLTAERIGEIERNRESRTVKLPYYTAEYADAQLDSGYANLEIHRFSEERVALLIATYKQIRSWQPPVYEVTTKDGREVRRELNGPVVLVYNESFDLESLRIGLRYNEDWAEEGESFGLPRDFLRYPSLDNISNSFIVEDWRNSKPVPRLKAVLPKVEGKTARDVQFEPLVAQSEDVVLLVAPHYMIEDITVGKGDYWCYVVETNRIRKAGRGAEGFTIRDVELPERRKIE